jgi:hypothetical protein
MWLRRATTESYDVAGLKIFVCLQRRKIVLLTLFLLNLLNGNFSGSNGCLKSSYRSERKRRSSRKSLNFARRTLLLEIETTILKLRNERSLKIALGSLCEKVVICIVVKIVFLSTFCLVTINWLHYFSPFKNSIH